MKVTKTNLALITALLGALITPQAMDANFNDLEIVVNSDDLLTLTANRDVTWLVLDGTSHQVVGRNIILSKPTTVIAISSGDYKIWEPGVITPDQEPNQLAVLIGSWIPERNSKVSENLAMIASKIKRGELSSKDMIMASLEYANNKDQVSSKWDSFNEKLAALLDQNNDWAKIFQVAAGVCDEAPRIS